MSPCIGIIAIFFVTRLQLNVAKLEEVTLLSQIILTGYIKIMENMILPLIGFPVHVHIVLLNLINICFQIVCHSLNQYMLTLKIVTITK